MSDDIRFMNKEEAERIVAAGEGADFDEALNYLRENAPDSEVLRAYTEQQEAAVKKIIDDALEAMRGDKNERDILGESKNDLSADDDIVKNLKSIAKIYGSDEFSSYVILTANSHASHVNVDDNGNILGKKEGKDAARIEEEEKLRKKIINEAMEAAKHEVLMFYARDKKFASYSDEQKRKILKDGVSDVFNFKMAKAVAASAVKEATAQEAVPNSKENEAYAQRSLADMRSALEAFYTKKPVTVKPQEILNTVVYTSNKMDEYEAGLRQQNLTNSADSFNKTKEDYNQKRRGFWGKAFDMAKNVLKGFKQNKARILTDAAVVVGAGLAATVAPLAAAAGMGLYFAASSYAWLVNDERRNQKAKSDDKANWTGFKGMKNAWNSINSDEKKKDKFWRQGTITAVAGVAGAGLFGAAASTIGLAAGRVASGAARAVGSVANQGTNWRLASKEYEKEATEENKAARDSARTGFWVSATAAVLANAVSAYFGLSNDTPTDGVEHAAAGAEADKLAATPTEATPTEPTPTEPTPTEPTPVDPAPVATVEVPSEWNADMGISEAHWNEMHDKITGIYKDHAAIFGKENVSPEEAMKNMYQNLENARVAGYFEGQTNEEVLYRYMKLIEQTERAEVLKGTNYLVTKLGADGQPMYWVNAEEMSALNKIIICNEKVDIAADRLGKTLALINDHGKYTGEGADVGVTNNRYVGGRYNCNEYQNAWEKGAFAQKHHQPHTGTPAEVAKVDETTIDNKTSVETAKVDETTTSTYRKPEEKIIGWDERKYTTGDNTADSGTGSHPEKIVKRGVAPEEAVRIAMAQQGLGGRKV